MKKSLSFFALLLTLAVATPVFAGGLGLVQPGTEPGFIAEDAILGTVPAGAVWIVVGQNETVDLGFSISMDQANVAQERINALTGFDPPTECDFDICSGLSDGELLMCVFEEQARCNEKAPVRIFAGWIDPSDPLCDYVIPFCKGAQLINKTDRAFAIRLGDVFRRK